MLLLRCISDSIDFEGVLALLDRSETGDVVKFLIVIIVCSIKVILSNLIFTKTTWRVLIDDHIIIVAMYTQCILLYVDLTEYLSSP